MKILVFSWRGPDHPHAGGAEYSSHEHAKGWVKAGNEVTLFTSTYDGGKKEEFVDGVHIIRRGNQVLGVHIRAFLWYLFEKHSKFDVVVDEVHGLPFFTPLYIGVPKLVFIHEVAKEVWRLNPWSFPFNLIPAILGTYLEPIIFEIIYRKIPFMTVSQSTKDDLIEWNIPQKNITVVNNGFVGIKSTAKKKENKKTLIYLGALSRDKGIEDALDVFSILSKRKRDINYWVVGKGESHYLQYLKNKVKKSNLEGAVRFYGFVSDREKYNLLSKAYILINPSIREGWGLVVIEAASVGTPTVAYNVAGLKDSVVNGETGLLSNPNSKDCAEAVQTLLDDESLYKSLAKNCLVWSKKFSWTESVRDSLKLLKKISSNY